MQTELFPGYRLIKLEETPGKIGFAYEVIGPKKTWRLMRNIPNPHMLFPIAVDAKSRVHAIRGYQWFTDRDGTVRTARCY